MDKQKIVSLVDKIIEFSFYALFSLIPLVLTPVNYELFEYNKMMLTYGLTIIIIAAWLVKMVCQKEVKIARTPFDIPLLLFFASQVISTIFSLDRHTSVWGYYSRSHGGLLSTISYLSLYYALVSNFSIKKIKTLLIVTLFSGLLVASYGILEHFGVDKDIWVQDVQARVFSTLGQPNWLAAYLAVLIPISIGLALSHVPSIFINMKNTPAKTLNQEPRTKYLKPILFTVLSSLFYVTLLYTRSRSGFLGVWIGLIILVSIFILPKITANTKVFLKPTVLILGIFLLFSFINGIPFLQFNKFMLPGILNPTAVQNEPPPKGAALDTGVTESGEIRKIVWQGAIDIIKANPLFGTGTETFAYSYYKFRPQAHNMVSEWDFLYNKAHNEYLNFGANNGLFGLGAYLLFIGSFIWWSFKSFRVATRNLGRLGRPYNNYADARSLTEFTPREIEGFEMTDQKDNNLILLIGLFSGWLSILITNFFGFSVVIVGLLFFLIPAISLILSQDLINTKPWVISFSNTYNLAKNLPGSKHITFTHHSLTHWPGEGGHPGSIARIIITTVILLMSFYLVLTLVKYWIADTKYATGYNLNHANSPTIAFDHLRKAVSLNYGEPLYHDELANNLASLAVLAANQKEATLSASLVESSIAETDRALAISPNNVNLVKSRTRVYYTLSQIDPQYNKEALNSIIYASTLAPTDAKVRYNLALLYGRIDDIDKAIVTLKETIKLKPNYRDAYYALALYYKDSGKKEDGVNQLKFILENIDPKDTDSQKKLDEWTGVQGAIKTSETK